MALSDDTLVVGAHLEDSSAIGVNGNQSSNGSSSSGAAYVFSGLANRPSITITPDGSGGYFIRGNGICGFNYQLQRTTSIPGSWTTNAAITATPPDVIEFHDTNAPIGQAFYRVVQQ